MQIMQHKTKQLLPIPLIICMVLTLILLFSTPVLAVDNPIPIPDAGGPGITNVTNAIQGAINSASAGDTVTVTNNISAQMPVYDGLSNSGALPPTINLVIPSGITVIWEADATNLTIDVSNSNSDGIFEMASGGSIVNDPSSGPLSAIVYDATSNTGFSIIISGGTVSSDDETIFVQNGIIEITGGTVTTTGTEGVAIYVADGDLIMSDGVVEATGNAPVSQTPAYPEAIAIDNGTAKITGGIVRATGTDGIAISLFDFSAAAYLAGTVTDGDFYTDDGNRDYSNYDGAEGMIVEVDTLSVPTSRDGTDDGLTTMSGSSSSAEWDIQIGVAPIISFTLTNSNPFIEWGTSYIPSSRGGGSSTGNARIVENQNQQPSQQNTTPETNTTTPVTGVGLDRTSVEMGVGETVQLRATVSPDNATNKGLSWTSNNSSVVSVDSNGRITANGPGTAMITVTSADGNFTATCLVTVEETSSGNGVIITIIVIAVLLLGAAGAYALYMQKKKA